MKNLTDFRKTVETGVDSCLRATSPLFNSFCSNVVKTKLHVFIVRFTVDYKTVGFFLKISKEIGEAWRKSLTHANRASLASFHSFCLTACSRAYLNTQKYGLFCSEVLPKFHVIAFF